MVKWLNERLFGDESSLHLQNFQFSWIISSTFRSPLSSAVADTFNFQLSTVNCQLSIYPPLLPADLLKNPLLPPLGLVVTTRVERDALTS